MATLNEAPKQLQEWIDGIDAEIARLTSQRALFVSAICTFWVEVPLDKPVVEAPPAPKPPLAKGMPARLKKAATNKPGESKYDYAEVARIANAAVEAGEPIARSVALHLSTSEANASKLIQSARQRGHVIGKGRTGRPPTPSNVTPITAADVNTAGHPAATRPGPQPGARAFTPDDTLKLLDRA